MITELRLHVPANSSWEQSCEADLLPAAWYLLDTINRRRQTWRYEDTGEAAGFVRLKCEYLRRIIGKSFQKVREALVNAGVIDWDRHYIPGVRCMRYRITAEFERSTIITCRDRQLVKAINRFNKTEEGRLLPVHRSLREKLAELVVDVDSAHSIISGMFPDEDSPLDKELYRSLQSDQITAFQDQVVTGTASLSCDDYGRVHTTLTRLPKSLRCCVTCHDGPLVAIDLANSQPLFAGLVALKYERSTKQKRSVMRKWVPSCKNPYGRRLRTHQSFLTSSITMGQSSEVAGTQCSCDIRLAGPPDLRNFVSLCESGQLYDSLKPPSMERADFKHRFFIDVFFGADKHPSLVRREFAAQFPTMAAVICDLKKHDHARLAWMMQHEESTLFIARICGRLMRERPSMPLYTIHDSLVTTKRHFDFIERVAMDEFYALGVTPTFKTEAWTD
jgi:hypothetical protein